MNPVKQALISGAVLPAILGFGGGRIRPEVMKETPVYSDDATVIEVSAGGEFTISLDSNPTTGYSWDFSRLPDPEVVELLDSSYQPPETPRIGAGGRQVWTFRAAGPGKTGIALEYFRPWEKGVPPARKAVFTVVVGESNRKSVISDR